MSSDFFDRISTLSPKRLALLALEQHERIEALEAQRHEPIAIVGLGCRFPGGANDPQAFWELLEQGRDAVREVPPDRWDIDAWYDADPDTPGRMSARAGGFLDRVDGFDAAFFGVSPREALTMDPQQRLALEVAWEALEHAGVAPAGLAGSACGVFVGVCNSDHFQRVLDRGDDAIDAYLASGNAHSVVSGRIAYFLGLRGPALSIDTACSSSLVALHVAVQSLRAGEVRMALAGGVNIMCSPQTTLALTKAHMLAPDGRCKTFDAAADGFSRGEGCGMLVLKRLADAQADGDRVLAVIRGSASNQDGRSGGLTVPSGPAQEAVIRAALADARLAPADIGYVEAHGTGTRLGDPIEVRALGAALGEGRGADRPLLVGSVKTNLGHLESAAGIAGVVKVVLALMHERIPPHLHFREPSPHIDWQRHPVQVVAGGCAWPHGGPLPRRAGVSSFGFSGTNAHVVLEEAPQPLPTPDDGPAAARGGRWHVLPLSARSRAALQALARRYVALLDDGVAPAAFAAIARGAACGRSHFTERLAVVADDAGTARAALQAWLQDLPHEALHEGRCAPGQSTEFAFMYTGQGAQYPGMAMRLHALEPVFAEVVDHCDALLGADAQGRSLKTVLAQAGEVEPAASIHDTAWTQCALFAVELGLTALWRHWGVPPAAVIGHSVGEYAAACAAGVFTLEEGLALVAERGRLMRALPPGGAMASVNAPLEALREAVSATGGRVGIAAFNAPDNVVVAGEAAAVEALLEQLAALDVQGQKLHVALAAHSPLVAPALDPLEAAARRVTMRAPQVPVAWNVTGGALEAGSAPDAAYWRRHLREPVRFAEGLRWLHGQGLRHFVEVGPHPTLSALGERNFAEGEAHFVGSLRRGRDDGLEIAHALARAYVLGAGIDWRAVHGRSAAAAACPLLPTYPFERQSYWIAATPPAAGRPAAAHVQHAPTPPASVSGCAPAPGGAASLLGHRIDLPVPAFELNLRPDAPAWLGEHRVHGAALVAGPVFIEMACAAAATLRGRVARRVAAFEVHAPLVLPGRGRLVQVHFAAGAGEAELCFECHSRAADPPAAGAPAAWTRHASGTLHFEDDTTLPPPIDVAQRAKDLGVPGACEPYYEQLRALGIALGPTFATLQQAHRGEGEVLARLQLADSALDDPVSLAHPGLLDGALQAVGLALASSREVEAPAGAPGPGTVFLLSGLRSLVIEAAPLPPTLWCHARLHPAAAGQPAERTADVSLHDDTGRCIGTALGVTLRRAAGETLQHLVAAAGDDDAAATGSDGVAWLGYEVTWEKAAASVRAAAWLRPPGATEAAAGQAFARLAGEHGMSIYEALLPELDRLSAAHVASALAELGLHGTPGQRLDAEAEAQRLGIATAHRRLFARLLEMLVEDGVLARRGSQLEWAQALPAHAAGAVAARHDELAARFAPVDGELSTLRRCGPLLARVLRGEQDPLQLLFPGGSFTEAAKLYVESPYARTYNGTLVAALGAALAQLPARARLRVLEVGAGTGGTTTYVLPLLAGLGAGRVEYTFTDLSPMFLERAAEQFAAYPFVERRLLDIERHPAEQGFARGQYDIVIAANVLHATADLARSVAHVRSLLAPSGQLLLLEGTVRERWVDLTFGLTEGWWRFADGALRSDYPLIGREAWQRLLAAQGFDATAMLPAAAAASSGAAARQALIVARARPRRWHLDGGPPALSSALRDRLQARGDEVVVTHDDHHQAADPAGAGGFDDWVYLGALGLASMPSVAASSAARHAADGAGAASPAGGPPRPPLADDARAARCEALAAQRPLRSLGALARAGRDAAAPRAWLVTQGVHRIDGEPATPDGRWMAPLWGLGRVFALEHPARWGGLVDLPVAGPPEPLADALLSSLDADDDEDQVAWRQAAHGPALERRVARLAAAPIAPEPALSSLRADATYLVTGGFGGLGQQVAAWLVEKGARHVALLGRRPQPQLPALRDLAARGARIVALAGDAADRAFIDTLPEQLAGLGAPPLAGILHLAADLGQAPIAELDAAQVQAMLRPKLAGTLALQALAQQAGLDWLVLFSSTTALIGAAGLAHYAAANAFLDATADAAPADGPSILSINWGTWEAMRLASATDRQAFQQAGLLPMRNADALAAMARLLARRARRGVVAQVDWAQLKPVHEARRARPFLGRVGIAAPAGGYPGAQPGAARSGGTGGAATAGAAALSLGRRLAAAPASARRDVLVEFVQREVAAVLRLPDAGAIALGTGLFDMGMDSLMAVELKRRLERGAGQPLPSTLTFNYPNVGALAGFLMQLLAPATAPGSPGLSATAGPAAPTPAAAPAALPGADEADSDLDDLSEDELEARLLATLDRTR